MVGVHGILGQRVKTLNMRPCVISTGVLARGHDIPKALMAAPLHSQDLDPLVAYIQENRHSSKECDVIILNRNFSEESYNDGYVTGQWIPEQTPKKRASNVFKCSN